jgi:ketosteroid isomerase-like protein
VGDTLQALIDKQALSELVYTYCRACDRRDFALVRTLYHDDAIDDHGAMFCGSADEYVAWLPQVMANFEATVHSISNALFVVHGDEAQGEIYTQAYHRTPAPAGREIIIGGRYLDRYARRAGAWKFLHRSLALDWVRLQAVDAAAYAEFAAGAPPGRTDATDPSYLALPFFSRSPPTS